MAKKRPDYRLATGEKIDSVTTIIGRMVAKPALVKWANKEGLEGRNINDNKAADIGTLAHALIESCLKHEAGPDIKRDFPDLSEADVTAALNSFAMFSEWLKSNQLETSHTELVLVSEKYRYGGTMDWVLRRVSDNAIWITDFKTSAEIYPEYIIQLAAYKQLFEENFPALKVQSCHILRVDKKAGGFDHSARMSDVTDRAFECFRHMVEANYLLKEIR